MEQTVRILVFAAENQKPTLLLHKLCISYEAQKGYEILPQLRRKDGQGGITMYNEMCGDNRFEIIAEAKRQLLEYTNIETSSDEMAVIDSFLFRCWQMGWLKSLDKKE